MNMRTEGLLWFTTAALFGGAIVSSKRDGASVLIQGSRSPNVPSLATIASADSLDTLVDVIRDGDVFRLARRPSNTAFEAKSPLSASVQQNPPPQPTIHAPLLLKAIVGGPPWQAVIDGIPGQPAGTLVRSGDKYEKIVVRSIGRDTVVIQSPDSTFRLVMRSAW